MLLAKKTENWNKISSLAGKICFLRFGLYN